MEVTKPGEDNDKYKRQWHCNLKFYKAFWNLSTFFKQSILNTLGKDYSYFIVLAKEENNKRGVFCA